MNDNPHEYEKKQEVQQTVRGNLVLPRDAQIEAELGIKVALSRNCRVLSSRVFRLQRQQRELSFELGFSHEGDQPMGVRLLVAPEGVPDEQMRALDHYQQWIGADRFEEGRAKVQAELPAELYRTWLRFCRTYTVRGRVICRRLVYDPQQHRIRTCESPVAGAKVTAYDVDLFWWWCHRQNVGSATTDLNGNFEITFRWCCWPWLWPWHEWRIDPLLVQRIRPLLEETPLAERVPRPSPEFDLGIFENLAREVTQAKARTELVAAAPADLEALGKTLVAHLPEAPALERLHVWPWWPRRDCQPDLIFHVEQECDGVDEVIVDESCSDARWNISNPLEGVTLVANDKACCRPCCFDPPEGDCLVFHGVGCGGYPITDIEQNPTNPLVGYGRPGSEDRPFGGTIRLLGAFGAASDVDYYKFQSRRILPGPATGWSDLPANQTGSFARGHWNGAGYQWETVETTIGGQEVYRTIDRYREEHPGLPDVMPIRGDWLGLWVTAGSSSPDASTHTTFPRLADGVYELRVVGYDYDADNDALVDEKVMALCPEPGTQIEPGDMTRMYLRLDNRISVDRAGTVHTDTSEPECDFPTIGAVVKNEGQPDEVTVGPCGILRAEAGDTITIHFTASDSDGHLEAYRLTAHWEESKVFNVLSVGEIAPAGSLYGPSYANTFNPPQAATRAALPPADPEHDRPAWYGGDYSVKVVVGAPVPRTMHHAFETCCAYLLRLHVWKRTTNGCSTPAYFHDNYCEFSFTLFRSDLIGDPNHPSCRDLCAEQEGRVR